MQVDFQNLPDSEWSEIFYGIRELVLSAGFEDWDRDFAAALSDNPIRLLPLERAAAYAESFAGFLKLRTAAKISSLETRLSETIVHEKREPIKVIFIGDEGFRAPMFENPVGLDLIEHLQEFAEAARARSTFETDPKPSDAAPRGPRI